ncbi:MAG: amidase family protein [Acidobacteria bacterium]|nr:amidase family protein [Acidobacteriota bacterium]
MTRSRRTVAHHENGERARRGRRWLAVAAAVLLLPAVAGAQGFQLLEATIADVHGAFAAGELTCRTLVQQYIDRIEAYDQTGPNLNAIQIVNPRSLERADELDAAYAESGPVGPLHCIPVLLKDQVETRDMPTTYGSALFEGFMSRRDATIVVRMRSAGALILAKTNMGEFASRYVGSAFGIIRNAYDPTRNPSGSSGGTGAGIAANFGMVGIGEDTGGSIRGPAAVHALVGLRPTLPLVSRFGMMPANPSSDTLGPMTRTVRDAALLLDAIAGYDANDPITAYTVGHVPDSYAAGLDPDGLRGARIGVIRESMDPKTNPDADDYKQVRALVDQALADMRALGATVIDPVTIAGLESAQRAYTANNFETERAMNGYLAEHENAPVKTVRDILVSGVVTPWRARGLINVVGQSTTDPGYLTILRVREELRRGVLTAMADNDLDALVYATFDHQTTVIAPDALTNANTQDAYARGNNRFLSPATGFPALTLPAGLTGDGLPIGVEMLGRPFTEATLFELGYAYEQGTHRREAPRTTPALAR